LFIYFSILIKKKVGNIMNNNKLLQKILRIPTTSLSDALDSIGIRGFMDYSIKPRTCNKKIVGPAVTIKDRPSNRKVTPIKALEAIENAPKGGLRPREPGKAGSPHLIANFRQIQRVHGIF